MNRSKIILIPLIMLAVPLAALGAAGTANHDRAGLDRFVAAHADKAAAPPFAFLYGGKAGAPLLKNWKTTSETKQAPGKTVRTVVYEDPATKLRITAAYTIYGDFPAIEWVLRFKNGGSADTPIIENLLACAVRFDDWPEGAATLYRALGSNAARSDFAPVADELAAGGEVRFGPSGGRSSDTTALPFFNIAGAGRGIVAAVGWSGKWKASVKRTAPTIVELTAGMDATKFRLHPGEEVRTPSIALVFWKSDDRFDGHNLFRRFVLAHHTPRVNGKPVELPFSRGVGFGGPFPCNEYVCATESYALAMIDRLRQFGIEPDACWIDAGWYENATRNWWTGVGNWTVNTANFPRGLKPVTDAARRWGKGFVVWFEPERVYEGTRLDREHPDWLTKLPGNPNRLLNLGDPRALSWLIDYITNFIQSEGVTVYRQDFNFDPAPYWKSMDAPDRIGIAEMKHIDGAVRLLGRASRRESRAPHRQLRLGRTADRPRDDRPERTALADGLPVLSSPTATSATPTACISSCPSSGTGNSNPRKYEFRSAMNGAVVVGWELNCILQLGQALEDIAEFRALRPYFWGDYYPLTEYSTGDDAWAAFQWDRPEERDGIVLAFRRPAGGAPRSPSARTGSTPAGDYEVSFEDYGITLVKTGRELAAGLTLKIPEAPGSLLIRYRRVR